MADIIIQVEKVDDKLRTTLNDCGDSSLDYKGFALIACDIIRHIARAFKVNENEVWSWVDKERYQPTTKITGQTFGNV